MTHHLVDGFVVQIVDLYGYPGSNRHHRVAVKRLRCPADPSAGMIFDVQYECSRETCPTELNVARDFIAKTQPTRKLADYSYAILPGGEYLFIPNRRPKANKKGAK